MEPANANQFIHSRLGVDVYEEKKGLPKKKPETAESGEAPK